MLAPSQVVSFAGFLEHHQPYDLLPWIFLFRHRMRKSACSRCLFFLFAASIREFSEGEVDSWVFGIEEWSVYPKTVVFFVKIPGCIEYAQSTTIIDTFIYVCMGEDDDMSETSKSLKCQVTNLVKFHHL